MLCEKKKFYKASTILLENFVLTMWHLYATYYHLHKYLLNNLYQHIISVSNVEFYHNLLDEFYIK